MVVSADRLRVHQVDHALLARVDHQFLALVIEDRRSDLHVQVALPEPLGVGGAVIIDQVHGFRLRVLLHPDDAVPIDAVLRVPGAVARARVQDTRGTYCGAGPAPHPATWRPPRADLVGGQVVGVDHVRIAAAALRGVRIDYVIDKAQRVRLSVRRHELRGRRDLFAVGDVQPPQRAVPGGCVKNVFAGRVSRSDGWCCGYAAGTQDVDASVSWRRRPRSLEVMFPEKLAFVDVNRVDVVRDAGDDHDLFGAARRRDAPYDQRGQQVVHLARLVIELDLPQQFHALDVGRRKNAFVPLPGGSLRIAAVSQPVGGLVVGQPVRAPGRYATTCHRDQYR